MPWSLEIHHLDIQHIGDSTIIIVKDGPIQRTVLVDGGTQPSGSIIHNYLLTIGVRKLDVIIVTHFDQDHFEGITWLLNRRSPRSGEAHLTHIRYRDAIVYDPGEPPTEYRGQGGNNIVTDYEAAIVESRVRRATRNVNGFDIVRYRQAAGGGLEPALPPSPAQSRQMQFPLPPNWLIGKDVLWGNGRDGLDGLLGWQEAVPPGNPPTMKCIAVNRYVSQTGGGSRYLTPRTAFNGPNIDLTRENSKAYNNEVSLAFLIQFNNFRYYLGGDLERAQEDGCTIVDLLPPVAYTGVKQYLNPADSVAGRVTAFKASHHGARTATSRDFVTRLRPGAVFISTSPANKFDHPATITVNVLDGYEELPPMAPNVLKYERHPPMPPAAPYRFVWHYLTSFAGIDPANNEGLTLGGDYSITAGYPAQVPGHVILEVSEAQSLRPQEGQVYRGFRAASIAILTAGNAQNAGQTAAAIAAEGMTRGTVAAVAMAIGASREVARHALEATAWVSDFYDATKQGNRRDGVITAALRALVGAADPAASALAAINLLNFPHRNPTVTPINQVPPGAAAAIAAAVTGRTADQIRDAAQRTGATVNAATAAGIVAAGVRGRFLDSAHGDSGYAVAAALGAAARLEAEGVPNPQVAPKATTIAAAILANFSHERRSSLEIANVTASLARIAGMAQADAALAGAVAAAAVQEGEPWSVQEATKGALEAAGFASADADGVAAVAEQQATLYPDDLYTVRFRERNVIRNYNHKY